jgi:hypothetical protein
MKVNMIIEMNVDVPRFNRTKPDQNKDNQINNIPKNVVRLEKLYDLTR